MQALGRMQAHMLARIAAPTTSTRKRTSSVGLKTDNAHGLPLGPSVSRSVIRVDQTGGRTAAVTTAAAGGGGGAAAVHCLLSRMSFGEGNSCAIIISSVRPSPLYVPVRRQLGLQQDDVRTLVHLLRTRGRTDVYVHVCAHGHIPPSVHMYHGTWSTLAETTSSRSSWAQAQKSTSRAIPKPQLTPGRAALGWI